nr:Membrane-bound O-acyltransferase family MBOAT [Leptospira interrogans serovar Copenhageni/Icterohaemorrhagiae]
MNLITTFTLGGFWHGASWTYVVWGFWHGFWLVIDRLMEKIGVPKLPEKGFIWWFVRAFFVYSIFMIGAVFFSCSIYLRCLARSLLWDSVDRRTYKINIKKFSANPIFDRGNFTPYIRIF